MMRDMSNWSLQRRNERLWKPRNHLLHSLESDKDDNLGDIYVDTVDKKVIIE